jgi:hypothetical protein
MKNLVNLINENLTSRLDVAILTIQEKLFPDYKKMDDDAVLLGFEVI